MGVSVNYDPQSKFPEMNPNHFMVNLLQTRGKSAILIIVIIIVYVFVLIYLGKTNEENNSILRILEIILWSVFIFIIIANIWYFKKPPSFQALFKPKNKDGVTELDVVVSGKRFDSDKKESGVHKHSPHDHTYVPPKNPGPNSKPHKHKPHSHNYTNNPAENVEDKIANKMKKKKTSTNKNNNTCDNDITLDDGTSQVYHIPNNKYTFDDSKAVCKAYGGRLAKYEELEQAYDDGANWCSYGWSKDQLALYPTQKEVWDKNQCKKGHEHDCGRPGINGGYIQNKNVKFGVNCYGPKPSIRQKDEDYMDRLQLDSVNADEQQQQKLEDDWKKRISDALVAPFNHDKWSAI